jgi:hypothetical protein
MLLEEGLVGEHVAHSLGQRNLLPVLEGSSGLGDCAVELLRGGLWNLSEDFLGGLERKKRGLRGR